MVRELPTKTTAPLFSTFMFAGVPNKSPLLTMNSIYTNCIPINHPSVPNFGNLYNLKRQVRLGLLNMRITNAFPNFHVDNQSGINKPRKVNNVKCKLNPRGSILNQNGNSDVGNYNQGQRSSQNVPTSRTGAQN